MTDTAPDTDTPDTPEPEAPEPASATQPDRLPDDHPVVKALNKANEEAKQARLKIKEFEDRDKTDQERLTERASSLEKDLSTAQADAARFEIALEKGLTRSQAKRLVGSTREELEADAEELLNDLGIADDSETPSPNRRPKERLRPGAAPDAEPEKSPEELAEAVAKRRGY